jgi:PAS domain S-box-containing protein
MIAEDLCEAHPDCVVVLDADGRVIYINPSGVRLWEFESKGAALGGRFADLWPVESQEKIDHAVRNVKSCANETGRASDMRWHETKDGRRFFAHGSINPILGRRFSQFLLGRIWKRFHVARRDFASWTLSSMLDNSPATIGLWRSIRSGRYERTAAGRCGAFAARGS